MIHTIFDNTTSELLRLVDEIDGEESIEDVGVLSYIEMHLEQEQVDVVQEKLKDILSYLESIQDGESHREGLRKYRLTIAHYPLDRFGKENIYELNFLCRRRVFTLRVSILLMSSKLMASGRIANFDLDR